ncbi:MAG: peptidoglycan DD-metalloendopeptidase family protein [Bauldia sp.]|nr:peptidoglycan DD-metalloendopeptidase family protein [Bauldia sp.]
MLLRLCLALAIGLGLAGSPNQALAQEPESAQLLAAQQAIIAERDRKIAELDSLSQQIQLSESRVAELTAEIAALTSDRATLNENLISTAERMRLLEGQLDATEARLAALANDEATIRTSLLERRDQLAGVLAALQRMGRRPAPAILVRAEDALASVRSAILLGAVVPDLRSEATELADDLARLVALEAGITAERDRLLVDATALAEERARLEILMNERAGAQARSQEALALERERAAALATEATSLGDLVTRMEGEIAAATEAAERARQSEEALEAALVPNSPTAPPTNLGEPDRLEPAVAFARARGLLPLPANGVLVTNYGADDGLGGKTTGITLETRPEAQVSTPADGWVVYAGPFRSYGQLLILNTGGGYHVVLAGMQRIIVELGQFVLAGEPVAVMGAHRTASVGPVGIDAAQPLLYVEFRKDGQAIDPGPWWIEAPDAKVGG